LKIPLITIYRSPADYPDVYVARAWDAQGLEPTDTAVVRETVEELREDIAAAGFTTCFPRAAGDDPCIIETYMQ